MKIFERIKKTCTTNGKTVNYEDMTDTQKKHFDETFVEFDKTFEQFEKTIASSEKLFDSFKR